MVTYRLPSSFMIKIQEYVDIVGESPFKKWFLSLDPIAAAKITTLGRIQEILRCGARDMALTKDFKSTIMYRAHKDKAFCEAMLSEAMNELLAGDPDIGKAILRDYINAAISFEVLSKMLEKNPKSVMRMLSPGGNPTSNSLFAIFHVIQKIQKVHFKITVS